MRTAASDPTGRTRRTVRARDRPAAAHAHAGRARRAGRGDGAARDGASGCTTRASSAPEIALLVSMFVISRYVLPLVERRDRGATGEEHVGALLDELAQRGWRVIHDASLGRGNVDHIVIGPGRRVHGRDQEPSRAGAGGAGARRARSARPRPSAGRSSG